MSARAWSEMKPDLAFRPFVATTGLPAQRALFADCFPETVGQPTALEQHYQWKFQGFPSKPPSFEYGGYLAEELIGYYAAIPYPYLFDGRPVGAGMVCDVMTGSRARGKGVFTKMGAFALEQMKAAGVDFVTGYPIRPEVLPGHLKVGWKVVQKMPIYIKVLRTSALLDLKGLGFLSRLGDLAASGLNFLPNRIPARATYSLEALTVPELLADATWPAFLEQWSKGVPNALLKDRAFLEWRLGAPETSYRIFVARDSTGALVAACVARNTVLSKIPALALLDLMILPGHRGAFRRIDRSLREHALESGAQVIATMIHPSWARKYGLGILGYLRSPFVFSLIVRKLNEALDDASLFEARRWHTMWIDSDDL